MKSQAQAARRRTAGVLVAGAALALAAGAHAGPVALEIVSDMVIVGPNSVEFGQGPFGGPFAAAPDGFGVFAAAVPPLGGVFASNGVTSGDSGGIRSLASPYETPGVEIAPPILFMTFSTNGSNLQLFATNIPVGDDGMFTATAIPGSLGELLSFVVEGYVLDTNTNTVVDDFSALFSTQTSRTLAQLEADGTPVTVDASIETSPISSAPGVPEPTSWALMITGFGLAGRALRRRRMRVA